ncbi:MAG TPA: T9SS type A sorting domain-containing protein [Phaeodactylibacter sp.]|nr:T9SS type A sorting domain-containing protein [Phaeodactylibacter sp.]
MVNLSVEAAPAASALTSPTNGSTGVAVLSSLDWEAVGSTNNYLLEIASDAGFSNILFSSNLSNTDYQFSSPLDYNTTYYWRITTANECGETQSAVYSFTTELNTGVNELEGIAFNIFPNPTSRDIHITFAKAIDSELRIQVFAVDGSLLKERSLGEGVQDIPLRLNYANGVYIIRLVMGSEVVGRRILLQR